MTPLLPVSPSRRRRPAPGQNLLRRFTLISLALTLVATALSTYAMGRLVESYLLGQVELEAYRRLDRVVRPLLPAEGLARPLSPERAATLDATVRRRLLEPPIERFALWDGTGQLLYESEPAIVSAPLGLMPAALASEPRHDVLGGPTGRRLRVVMPAGRGASVGVYEVDEDFEPLAAHIAEMQRFAAASLGGFSLLLYLLLFRLVRRAARDLADEAAANARLSEEAQRSAAVASALLRTAEALSRLVPLDQLLADVAARAVELLGGDDALIFLAEEDGRRFTLRASAGVPPEKLAAFPLQTVDPWAFPAFAAVSAGHGPLVIADAPCSPLVPSGLVDWWGVKSCVFVPLEAGGRLEGVMVVHFNRTVRDCSAEALRLAAGLAGQAAVAIANTRAFETVGEVEALREVNRLKNEFVSLVSHELRTPLSGVVGFAELLAMREFSPEQVKDFAGELHREALHLSKLVDDLLDLGRLESGRFSLTLEPIDLAAFAEETAARFARTSLAHQIAVVAAARPLVAADRGRLRQVLDNLVGNAIRYSPAGGPIELCVDQTAPGRACVAVRDHGLGIALEEFGRLFEHFYRSGRQEVRAIKGTGLGLAIAQAIVAAHGGTIRVDSPGPGQGSTFTIDLPVAVATDRPASLDSLLPLPQLA